MDLARPVCPFALNQTSNVVMFITIDNSTALCGHGRQRRKNLFLHYTSGTLWQTTMCDISKDFTPLVVESYSEGASSPSRTSVSSSSPSTGISHLETCVDSGYSRMIYTDLGIALAGRELQRSFNPVPGRLFTRQCIVSLLSLFLFIQGMGLLVQVSHYY